MLSFRKANFQLFRDSNNRTPCKSVLMSKNAEQRWQTSREALRPQVQQVRKHRQETSVAGAAQAKQKRLRTSISTEARLEMWGRKRREETAGQRSRWPGFTFGSGRLCSVPPECAFLGRFVWRISDVNFSSSAALLWTLSPSISWSGSPSCTQRWRRGRTAQSRAGSRFPGLAVLGLTQPRVRLSLLTARRTAGSDSTGPQTRSLFARLRSRTSPLMSAHRARAAHPRCRTQRSPFFVQMGTPSFCPDLK
ncbi:uncharacterized protein LOC122170133 isoform X2 [Centrocercus urophasianus]|nr:uncharacterized protein LOC122170133 isoform X2 [Centrocercus urophasianus]